VVRVGILLGMTATTIKVDDAVRDRLARVAHARGTTMTALLADLAQRLDEEQRWTEINNAYERYRREDPGGWQDYLAEMALWDQTAGDGLLDPREDWPEHNQ
jgi:hypothetical protein